MDCINIRKAAVVGCGFVGAATAFALMQSGLFSELVLIDSDKEKAEGEALDISHGMPFAKPMDIYAGDYDDITDANLVIVMTSHFTKIVKRHTRYINTAPRGYLTVPVFTEYKSMNAPAVHT